jgi:O-antigen ligase
MLMYSVLFCGSQNCRFETLMMKTKILTFIKENLRTRRDWGIALTAFVPIALVMGRAPADWVVSVVAVLFLFDSLVRRQADWAKEAWVAAALFLWAYSVVRAAFIPDDAGAGLFAAFAWLRYIVFAASVTRWTLADERGRLWLIYATIASVLFMSIDGLIQYAFGRDIFGHALYLGERLTGPFKRPIFGMTIANLFAPAVFWLLMRKQYLNSVLLANVCFAAIFLSGDRMAFYFAAVIMVTWMFFFMRAKAKLWWVLVLTLCFFAALINFSPRLATRQLQSTAETVETVVSSPYGLVWKSAWDVGKDHPLFGVGIHQFRKACRDERYGPVGVPSTNSERCHTHTHNAYLEWFSEGGVVGLLGFVGFVFTVGFGLLRRVASQKADVVLWGLAAMLGVRLLPFFITTSFFNNWAAIPFWLALGWAMSYKPGSFFRNRVM